jgi:hypothetical protein
MIPWAKIGKISGRPYASGPFFFTYIINKKESDTYRKLGGRKDGEF